MSFRWNYPDQVQRCNLSLRDLMFRSNYYTHGVKEWVQQVITRAPAM